MTLVVIGMLACVLWVYLLAARGGFWRGAQRDDAGVTTGEEGNAWPAVVAIVPARDEAAVIGDTLRSLLQQDYRGSFGVIVVDDHSSDDTAARVRETAAVAAGSGRVTVIAAASLPPDWSGKLWAVHCGIGYVQGLPAPPEYLLLTDADIRHADDALTNLVGRALRDRLVLTSLMAGLR